MAEGIPVLVDRSRTVATSKRAQHKRDVPACWAVVPLFVLDAVCIVSSMLIAYHLRFNLLDYHAPLSSEFYGRLVVAAVLLWEVVFAFYKLYHPEHLFGGVQEYGNVFNGCTVGLVSLVVYTFVDRRFGQDISRGWLAMVWFRSSS